MASIDDYLNEEAGALPEAPASVTYKMISPNGFDQMITFRAHSDVELFDIMGSVERHFLDQGYTSQGGGKKSSKSYSGGSESYEKPRYSSKSSGKPWSNEPATPKQKDVLVDWGIWEEGMSKQEASDKISERLDK